MADGRDVCNNTDDMIAEMPQLGPAQELRHGAGALPAEQILRIATRDGARALGLESTGVLAPGGAAADLYDRVL